MIGHRIAAFRAARDRSVEDLSRELRVTAGELGRIESGEQPVSAAQLVRLAVVLQVRIGDLVGASGAAVTDDELARAVDAIEDPVLREWVRGLSLKKPEA